MQHRVRWALALSVVLLGGCVTPYLDMKDPTPDGSEGTIVRMPAANVMTLAGKAGAPGAVDGAGADARFERPFGIAVDAQGNLFVAEYETHTIRKVTPEGVVSTFAGKTGTSGHVDGSGAQARFNDPAGMALDSQGNLYVADSDNQVIRKISPEGVVSTFAGQVGNDGFADGEALRAQFRGPMGVAVDAQDNVFVVDTANHAIRKITPQGIVNTLAGQAGVSGSADGAATQASFNFPTSAAFDPQGNLLVTDTSNHLIRKLTPQGAVSTFAGKVGAKGSLDAPRAEARFNQPAMIAVDAEGNAYVTDVGNHTVRKLLLDGRVITFAGHAGAFGSTDGNLLAARFFSPTGIAVDAKARLYVSEFGNHTIRKLW